MANKNKVLITGGAGFIGANLCRRLLNDGYNVICMDNFFTGKRNNILDLIPNMDFRLIEHDVTEPFDVNVDKIYHLAAPASPVHYQKNPIYTMQTIFMGTLNALECAKKNNVPIVIASTSEVYGEPKVHPQNENYNGNVNMVGIRACYDEAKRCGETLASEYRRCYGVDTKIIRIFNTYGPYMDVNDGRVVSEFITNILNNKIVAINGDGTQTRSFCYIDDLIEAMLSVMNSKEAGPFNVGNPYEITVNELLKIIASLIGKSYRIKHAELPSDDPTKRKPNIEKISQTLNWIPQVDIKDGLASTIKYFEKILAL